MLKMHCRIGPKDYLRVLGPKDTSGRGPVVEAWQGQQCCAIALTPRQAVHLAKELLRVYDTAPTKEEWEGSL